MTFDVAETWYKQLHSGDLAQVTYDPRRMSVHDIRKMPDLRPTGGSPVSTT